VQSLFTDDDRHEHLKWEWSFEIKKDWKAWASGVGQSVVYSRASRPVYTDVGVRLYLLICV
jgi:hypothetical protein